MIQKFKRILLFKDYWATAGSYRPFFEAMKDSPGGMRSGVEVRRERGRTFRIELICSIE